MSGLLVRPSTSALPASCLATLARNGQDTLDYEASGLHFHVSPLVIDSQSRGQAYQPTPDSLVIVAGWLLNREELSTQLDFEAEDDDGKVVWQAYQRWGEDVWPKLLGEYVIVVLHQQKLYIASDHFATRSLYWSSSGSGLFASTDISTLANLLKPDWNSTAVAHFLTFGRQVSPTATEYSGVQRLPPAHVLSWDQGQSQLTKYWEPPPAVYQPRAAVQQVEGFRDVLSRALRARLRCPKLGCELSGGLDSTSLLATACETTESSRFCAFTTGFRSQDWDKEPSFARQTAEDLGVGHREIWFEEHATGVLSLDDWASSLVLNSPDSPWRAKFQAAKEFSPVLLCGDGGDPALGWSGWEDSQSNPLKQVYNLLQSLYLRFRVWGPSLKGFGIRQRFLSMGRPSVERELPLWLNPDLVADEQLGRVVQEQVEQSDGEGQRVGMTCSPFWGDLFRRRSPDATGCALHVTYPYFDLRVWSYLNTVTPVPWFQRKALSRLALRGRVREEIITRPKATSQPFSSTSAWLLREYDSWFDELWDRHQDSLEPYLNKTQLFTSLRQLETLPFPQQYQLLAALRFMRWAGARP